MVGMVEEEEVWCSDGGEGRYGEGREGVAKEET